MDVSDILRDRVQEPEGLQRMAVVSVGLHVLLLVLIVVAPSGWFTAREPEPRSVMTITLGGGAPGPANTGMTPLAARPVQAPQPIEAPAPRRPEPVRPPAARTPEMVIPRENAAPPRTTTPPPRVSDAPPEARGTTPTRGAEPSSGQGIAETGARGRGFGLASGGGGGGAGYRLDVGDFCCPEYIARSIERIRGNWNARAEVPGDVEVRFTIQRNGTITNVEVERTSGFQALDINAQRALILTRQLDPLPAQFPNSTLTVYLTFQYRR
jgi:TonB family protein